MLILGGVGLVLMGVVYLRFLFFPSLQKIGALQKEAREKSREVASIKQDFTKLPEIKNNIAKLRLKAEELEHNFPSEAELPNLLEHLSDVAEKADVKIVEISPGKSSPAMRKAPGAYQELPIVIMAKSGYHELGSFINQLENSERLFSVSGLSIKADPADQRAHHVRLVLETFVREKEAH